MPNVIKTGLSSLLMSLSASLAMAAPFHAQILDQQGQPVADAVLTLQGPPGKAALATKADMDQRSKEFAPHVMAVHTGTNVTFPNSDNIRHQVYSFSPAKRFELRLYEGTPTAPLLFDKAGIVVLGCNIHDWMLGYIYVTEDPWFATSDAKGQITFADLPAGHYNVTLWHPQNADMATQSGGEVVVADKAQEKSYSMTLQPLNPDAPSAPAPSAFGDAFGKAVRETEK
jgi:plastocyanin